MSWLCNGSRCSTSNAADSLERRRSLSFCKRRSCGLEPSWSWMKRGWLVIEVAETDSLREQLIGVDGDRLVTVAEVSERTGFTAGAVRDWIKRAVLPAVRVGKEYRVREEDLAKLLAGKTPETLSISKRIGRRRKAVAV